MIEIVCRGLIRLRTQIEPSTSIAHHFGRLCQDLSDLFFVDHLK